METAAGSESPWRKSTFSFANGNCAEVAGWRKSTDSHVNGNCAEITAFRTAMASEAGNCVEAGNGSSVIGIRDTQEASHPYRVTLEVPAGAWGAFTSRIKEGFQLT